MPAGEAAAAAQAAALAAPPPPPGRGPGFVRGRGRRSDQPRHGPRHAAGPLNRPRVGSGIFESDATAAAEGREGAKYRAHTKSSRTHVTPAKPYAPKGDFPEGRPLPVRPPTPKRTPMGITLPQLPRRVV